MDPEERTRLQNIQAVRNGMLAIERGLEKRTRQSKFSDLGLCGNCQHMHGEITRYGSRRSICTALYRPRVITSNDPLVDCTDYVASGMLPLQFMISMAVPIEAKTSRPIGFITTDSELEEDELLAELEEELES